jgi:glucan phosphoethanolaminetransferase (alkaline phosphatase superfamily)
MNKNTKPTAIQAKVMGEIHSGSLRMKPKIFFTLLWALGIIASLGAGLAFAYFISILTFLIRIQTASTPAYGARQNLSETIATFPWWSVILTLVLAGIAFWLLRKYSRIYRYRMSVIILIFVGVSMLMGIGMSYSNIVHSTRQNNHSDSSEQRNGLGNGRGSGLQKN